MRAVLIATLGAEPQVISLTTQLLLQQQEPLVAVVVLHTHRAYAPVAESLSALQIAFATQSTWPPLQTVCVPVNDVLTPLQMEEFTNALYALIKQWVAEQVCVHLQLAGGRKSMAMLGISVAQLLLGPLDRLWYLHSDETLRRSGRMVLNEDDHVRLIAIPLPQLTAAPPIFTRPFQATTPADARHVLAAEQQKHRQHFVEHELTPAEREVAALVVQDVLTVKEIAVRLCKSPKTVTNQLNTIYSKLESAFGLQPDVGVKREFLRRELGSWFNGVNLG